MLGVSRVWLITCMPLVIIVGERWWINYIVTGSPNLMINPQIDVEAGNSFHTDIRSFDTCHGLGLRMPAVFLFGTNRADAFDIR